MLAAAGLLCGLLHDQAAGQGTPTVVGTEASIPIPPSGLWNMAVNLRPGNGETVYLNPPIISWCYCPGGPTNIAVDVQEYNFQLQMDYTGAFASPVVNVTTPCNLYNFLAPFASNTVYWRVGYISVTNNTTNRWITNSFTIAPNATNWDRSMLADADYMAGKAAHPHILFNAGNKAALASWLAAGHAGAWWRRRQPSPPTRCNNPIGQMGSNRLTTWISRLFIWETWPSCGK